MNRRTDNTMAKSNRIKVQTTIYKTIHIKLKVGVWFQRYSVFLFSKIYTILASNFIIFKVVFNVFYLPVNWASVYA